MMLSYRFVLIAIISLLLTSTVNARCYRRPANQNHCNGAINKITFQEGKLPMIENEVVAILDTCSLIVRNLHQQVVTKDLIKSGVAELFKQCPGKCGSVKVPSNPKVSVLVKMRAPAGTQWEAWNADAELNKPYCYQPNGEPEVKSKYDCIKAYNQIPIDSQGHLTHKSKGLLTQMGVTFGSCTLALTSTDGSIFQLNKKDTAPIITKMIQQCDKKVRN
ncbi:uncharacterized protein PGTG_04867 [Puccinia graminis f. sp. tritici CRL 75-36-700-3]|uniref:Uncharacterized protein n=1 Tax=Puccinia graminis f. sp. tritici (strain CRL 75-36-700-3 / race SCCL) TaxID=418459 RepID=E3K354_PUCGT|nr:uncharacterized protein PGTG_04867 [Puccinia graminis f. sp. tritici CRL 75-36-700-3]EFP78911.2 hypothetical protein PGTG_04867 [Puccinia graminis f. sp. tritici CRL 75-36-700-3]